MMDRPDRPTEAQILGWLRLYVPGGGEPGRVLARPADLPRLARILWLRYCAEPAQSPQAIGEEYGLSSGRTSAWLQRGLAQLVSLEEQGVLPGSWNPQSSLGRAVIRWRIRHRPFVPRLLPPTPAEATHARQGAPKRPRAGFPVPGDNVGMARREKRWERPLDQLREEFKRLEGELDDAADLAAEQEREIVRLGERIERLEDELEEARRTAGADDDDRRPDAGAPRGRPGWADQVMTSAPFRAQDCC